jgi:hypothetical protein
MDKTNLVILKGSKPLEFQTETLQPNTNYRCIQIEDQYMVYGIIMDAEAFNKHFEYSYDRIMRHWEQLCLVKDGKPVSQTSFNKIVDVRNYGKLKIVYTYTHPKELMYGFYPTQDNKKNSLKECYQMLVDTVNGNMEHFDNSDIQFGNSGIPLCYNDLRVR